MGTFKTGVVSTEDQEKNRIEAEKLFLSVMEQAARGNITVDSAYLRLEAAKEIARYYGVIRTPA